MKSVAAMLALAGATGGLMLGAACHGGAATGVNQASVTLVQGGGGLGEGGQPAALAPNGAKPDSGRPRYDSTGRPLAATVLAGASKTWNQQSALDAGVQWLLDNQHKDGRWGNVLPQRPADIYLGGLNSLHAFGNASTALCLMALMLQPRTDVIDAAIAKGFAYLIEAPEAKRIQGDTFYNTWAHCYMVEAFSLALKNGRVTAIEGAVRKRCQFELDRLMNLQTCDGGFGYYDFGNNLIRPGGKESTSFNAATALVALRRARDAGFTVQQRETDLALRTLARMRFPDGAYAYSRDWVYSPTGGPSRIEGGLCRATACNYALNMYGKTVTAANVKTGLDNLFNHHDYVEIARQRQYPHETWFQNAPYYYYYGHYYAALSLEALEAGDRAEYGGKLAAFVGITADKDGSFWDYPLYGYTKAYGTGYGVLILSLCKAAQGGDVTKATAAK